MQVLRPLVFDPMENQQPQAPLKINQLRGLDLVLEIFRGIGALFGMGILWGLEIVRNRYFQLLDRFNIRARRKRASAFPPGPKQKRAA